MGTARDRFPFRDVVLVADVFDLSASSAAVHERRDLERTDPETLAALRAAISELGLRVHHYEGPDALAKNASAHKDDIVFAIYGGAGSRNRMALVPAICETFGLNFIGPDVYGRIIAQDKEISKRLAADCGLSTPPWRLVRDRRHLSDPIGLTFPVVVKPLAEGSSVGVSQRSRVASPQEAISLAADLLHRFDQPVLIEEFVPGREVSYCRIEGADGGHWAFSEVIIEGQPNFFETRLFDAQEKLFRTPGRSVRNIDPELQPKLRQQLERLLKTFGRYGYCRIDGRFVGKQFHFLELTPDAWIGTRGQFAMGFTEKGWTYVDVIEALLASANSSHPHQSASD